MRYRGNARAARETRIATGARTGPAIPRRVMMREIRYRTLRRDGALTTSSPPGRSRPKQACSVELISGMCSSTSLNAMMSNRPLSPNAPGKKPRRTSWPRARVACATALSGSMPSVSKSYSAASRNQPWAHPTSNSLGRSIVSGGDKSLSRRISRWKFACAGLLAHFPARIRPNRPLGLLEDVGLQVASFVAARRALEVPRSQAGIQCGAANRTGLLQGSLSQKR